jgi:hypothetical protein
MRKGDERMSKVITESDVEENVLAIPESMAEKVVG